MENEDRALKLQMCSVARPHMRAFHLSWLSLFISFLGWFAILPLLPTIKEELDFTSAEVQTSNILAISSTILGRVAVGPLCDRYGPRSVQSMLMILGAVPVVLSATVTSAMGFMIVRFFIGFLGCAFVCAQAWVADMFANDIVGTANAVVGGWGNIGGAACFLAMPLVFDLFHSSDSISPDTAWRLSMAFPAFCLVLIGLVLRSAADDSPRGWSHAADTTTGTDNAGGKEHSSIGLICQALSNPNAVILAIQYACCFGVELQVNSVLSLYFFQEFTKDGCDPRTDPQECRLLTQNTAGMMASVVGLMNIFSRALGGMVSDKCNQKFSMKGRLWILSSCLLFQAVFLLLFSRMESLLPAGLTLVAFALFVQASSGATFAIVPYVWPKYTGSVSGIVGAGGNIGAVCWGLLFKAVDTPQDGFMILACIVATSCLLTPLLRFV